MKPLTFSLVYLLILLPIINSGAQDNSTALMMSKGSLEEAGINKDSIAHLLDDISNIAQHDFRGLVVIKDNKIVIEEYYNTFWRNSILDIRSAGKSVTALLLGVAIKDGLVKSLDQDLYSFFPKNKYPTITEDYKNINLRHLLNMSSGLDADSDDSHTKGNASNWIAKDNWKDYILSIPLTAKPGSKWVYADINPLLIAAVIEEKSGMSLRDYANEKLFAPLGIEQFYWYTNRSNQTGAAGNLYISTLDFAKLGMLVANEGSWNNEQLIDFKYMQNLITSEFFNISENNPYADAYGMLWYKSHRTFGHKKIDYLFASGNGGNHLIVIPSENMIIALTSSAYGQVYAHKRAYNIMSRVLAAVE
ncbi:serine hydrolase domain-containing protein [Fulvivirga ligni]|uniref:serine hydrolase domain-containing protein n=1 Tax=Fulvivirga ligni TaxID=2904246 RepID=UPI001F34FA1A|nr:serine hydrolase [Fulvivirga ligni]UII21365.1 beta-lactamase family protein [Fulvivirga ligni]